MGSMSVTAKPFAVPPLTPPDVDWRALLAPSGAGFIGDERNVILALRNAPELAGLVRFNEFRLDVEFTRAPPWRNHEAGAAWGEADDTSLAAWLQERGLKVRGRAVVADSVVVAARDRQFHPVKLYLESLKWDGTVRLDSWLVDYLHAKGAPEYLAAIGRRFMVSAVARILNPGCQADHALVLEAPQGFGKTSAARVLAVRPEWFAGNLPDVHGKDAAMQLVGRWVVEIAEMRAVKASEIEATKNFLTQTADTFRPPYGRRTAQFPRQNVFIGTTNEREYLRDRTGNRRWWPVLCGRVDASVLAEAIDQLYAEAVVEFRAGAQWHLLDHEEVLAADEQQARVPRTEIEVEVGEYLAQLTSRETNTRDVMVYGLRLDPDKSDYIERARRIGREVSEAIEMCGWVRKGRREGGGQNRRTVYLRPEK